MGNEKNLVVINRNIDPAKVFSEGGIDGILNEIEAEVMSFVPDITTACGRKSLASLANKVARSKTFLDSLGKKLVADKKADVKKIDAERKKCRDFLDDLKKRVREPLTEFENEEKAMKEKKLAILAEITSLTVFDGEAPSDIVSERLAHARRLDVQPDIFLDDAAAAQDRLNSAIQTLETFLANALKAEAEKAELDKLRAEKAEMEAAAEAERREKEKAKRDERIRREAAAEAERREKAALEAVEREKEAREAERLAAEAALREAEEKARAEAAEAVIRERERAEAEARRVEAERIEMERSAAEAEARRIADKEHRATIQSGILSHLTRIGLNEAQAKDVIREVCDGNIPNLTIIY